MLSWDTCKQDFEWDGSLRDIYISPASLDDWRAVFPLLRVQPEIEFVRELGADTIPEDIDVTFFGDSRLMLRFRVGGVLIVFHFFTPDEIECDIDPREVTDQVTLDAVLTFMQQLGDLTRKCAVLTPENAPDKPIISYDPLNSQFKYHEITF